MFVISPVSALHSYASCRPTARDRYLAAIAQAQAEYARDQALEQQRAREAYARRQREQQLTKQLILDALYAQANEYDGVCPMGFNKPWAYTRYAREHAERLARERQVALEQACLARGRRNQDRIPQTINMSACHQKDEPTQKPESAQDSLKKQLEEQLEARLMEEYESDMRETVQSLMKHVSESSVAASTEEVTTIAQPIPDTKGKTKQASFDISAPSDSETESDSEPTMDPSAIQRSLSAISEIEASFRALEADFVFPTELDFTHSSDGGLKLSYSSRNAPVRFYDDALSQLLSRLDGVASYGSREIRDARKKLVRTVSRSLEEVEKEVERRRVAVIARDLEAGRTTVSEPESPPVDMDSTAIADTTEAPATPRPDAIHSATEAVSVAEPHEAPSDAAVGPDSELAQDAAVTQNSFDGVAPLIATPTTVDEAAAQADEGTTIDEPNNQVLTASDSSGTTTLGVDNSSPTSSESILPVASEIPADIAPPSNLPHEAAEHVLMGTSEPSSPLTQTSVLSSSSPTPSTFLNSEDDVVLVDEDAWSEVEA